MYFNHNFICLFIQTWVRISLNNNISIRQFRTQIGTANLYIIVPLGRLMGKW